MKVSYPVEVAEYAEAVGISDETAFSWWTGHVLNKRQKIIAAVNKRDTKVHTSLGSRFPKLWRKHWVWTRKMGMTYGRR